jgi:hypothetical protein
VLDVARGFNVLRQVDSVIGQRDPNAAQDVSRAGLIVNSIEGGGSMLLCMAAFELGIKTRRALR